MPAACRLFAVFALPFVLVTCQPGDSAPPDARPTPDSARVAADSLARMTDGGHTAMPQAERRELIRKDSLWKKAFRIHYNAIVMDGHMDTPTLMVDDGYQLAERHSQQKAHVDLPRMKEGGLDGAFFSLYVAAGYGEGAAAQQRARTLIRTVKRQVREADSARIARSADDVRRLAKNGQKAILMGLEGGHALAASPDTLRAFADAGVRYVTLTHANTNSWADASQSAPRHGGLNEKGRDFIRTMNRFGVIVDCSHVSDSTFYDAVRTSEAPVIFSHSSARALVDNVRNVSDDMLRALKKNDGVLMVNFYSLMINHHLTEEVMNEVYTRIDTSGASLRNLWQVIYDVRRERGLPNATLDDLLDHIDHAVQVAGIDHVGLGSDFDGVGTLPNEMQDVSALPRITYGLLKRGYSERAIYKILGGNTLRVLDDVKRVSERMSG
jgi:membrane dipeptidase